MKRIKKPWIFIIIAISLIGIFFLVRQFSQKPNISPDKTAKATIKEIMGFAGSLECKYEDGLGTSGTIYGKNMIIAGDMVGKTKKGKTINSHVFYDTENLYVWFDKESEGVKAPFDLIESVKIEKAEEGFDITREVYYECHKYTKDESKFVIPKDVKFTDYSNIRAPQGETDIKILDASSGAHTLE